MIRRNDDPPDDDTGAADFAEEIYDTLALIQPKTELSEDWLVNASDAMLALCGRSYMEGYRRGQHDEAMARDHSAQEFDYPARSAREFYKDEKK